MTLQVRGLGRRLDGRWLVHGADLELEAGRTLCVVGPSGCGKTSLLRLLAGLDRPDAGSIVVDGRDVTQRPAERRPVAMVFQSETLFPELTVAQNIGFGLQARRVPAARREEAVEVALLRLGLTGLGDRLPHQLSGGQQRRVAVARSLVLRPRVLLLDEPMGGLDEMSRAQLSRQLRTLAARGLSHGGGTAVVHVTHDQAEALSSGDLLAVMDQGRILQQGTPREVFTRPASARVAAFLGRSNFLDVDLLGATGRPGAAQARVHVLGRDLQVACHDELLGAAPGGASLLVRPGSVQLSPAPEAPVARAREVHGDVGIVQHVAYLGDHLDVVVETERGTVVAACAPSARWVAGDGVRVQVVGQECWVLARQR
ncbi:ABC transporter ATP-binding protein [Luteococcus peritonei]|uniref:ABC transporter ATP-binding protein n=1 Tax=Luteococcus peritonei TaxID=88874 RepID=A0ABW4RUL8_9ACTN